MKSKIITVGVILLIIAFSGCSSEDEEYNYGHNTSQNSSNIEKVNETGFNYEASGYCYHVVDGDTIDVEGVGRIRLVGVDTPERGEEGYHESKDFVRNICLEKTVFLDIDNKRHHDKYGRTLAVVYVDNINVNAELLKKGYAKVLYIPPSEFNPYSWT